MRRILGSLVIILIGSTSLLAGAAEAHVLRSSNGTDVVMHIQPYDHPQAKVPVQLVFDFTSDNNNVFLTDCTCKVVLSENGKTLKRTLLTGGYPGAGNEGSLDLTFPEIGVYDLAFTGTSKTGKFDTFNMTWPIRVATVSPDAPKGGLDGRIFAGSIIGLLVLGGGVLTVLRVRGN